MRLKASNPDTFEKALERFEEIEADLSLYDWCISGVNAWKLNRFSLFRSYREHHRLVNPAHPETSRLKKSKVRMVCDFPKPFVFQNPFLMAGRRVDRVVIPSPRKCHYDGRLVDPISYPVWRPPYEHATTVLDRTNPLNPTLLPDAPSFEVLLRLAWIRRQAVRTQLESKDREIISGLSQELFQENYSSALELRISRSVRAFIGLKSVFMAFLKRTQPNYLYIVCSYGCEAIIAAARDLGIEVVEFQHGSVGRGHLGYDFKGWQNVPYFPDRILAFGTEWFSEAFLPEGCIVDPIGYSALENAIAGGNERVERRLKQILALSQGPIASGLLEALAEFCVRRPDWRVVIRPHPNENADHLRHQMSTIATTDNWWVEKQCSLQEHTAISAVVFGVNSTALIEALLAGCRVALLDAENSVGYFDSLAVDGHATKVKNGEELAKVVDDLPSGSARGYFANPIDDIVAHVEGSIP